MGVLVSQMACEFFPEIFEDIEKFVPKHKKHRRSTEMSKKSKLFALPMFFHNQIKNSEVIDMLREFRDYLISLYRFAFNVPIGPLPEDVIDRMLIFADELLVVRGWSAQRLCANGCNPDDRLSIFFFTFSDWHAIVVIYIVYWKIHYNGKSIREHGTMCHGRNLIMRRNVKTDPSDNVNASKDFLRTWTRAHLKSALRSFFGMKKGSNIPHEHVPPSKTAPDAYKKQYINETFTAFVSKFLTFRLDSHEGVSNGDGRCNYHRSCLNYGMFIFFWEDIINEGDGDGNVIAHKIALLHFFHTGHWKYAIQMFVGLANVLCLFTARLREQYKYERFVNILSGEGNNHEGDVVLEYRNGELKKDVKPQGPELTKESVNMAALNFDFVRDFTDALNSAADVRKRRGHHKRKSDEKDLNVIVEVLDSALRTLFSNFVSNYVPNYFVCWF
eukprot:Lithocolla_globosa_v1_NODE_3048_length_1781_cov_180.549826.p1 type:complete len:443 gc:universal NODE_3048_length_1781_cov_180.549826:207-1535(+)